MNDNRSGESGPPPSRHSRFFKQGSHWFFTTRECSIIGPYDDFQDALLGCHKFKKQIQAISDFHTNASPTQTECV